MPRPDEEEKKGKRGPGAGQVQPVQSSLAAMPSPSQQPTQAEQPPVVQARPAQTTQQAPQPVQAQPITMQRAAPQMQPGTQQFAQMQPGGVQQPKLSPGYQQRAAAITDPRFAQALTEKFQQDLAAKQSEFQKQQQEFQQKMQGAPGLGGAQSKINEIMTKISAGQATDADLAEYQRLQSLEYKGPEGLEGSANIAALSRMAGSPALLAQQYAQLAPGAISGQQIAQSLTGLGGSPGLAGIRESAASLGQRQKSFESAAEQQVGSAKQQTEAIKKQAKQTVEAEKSKLLSSLTGKQQTDILQKKQALEAVKGGLFTGAAQDAASLSKLGIKQEDINKITSRLPRDIFKFEGVSTPQQFEAKMKSLSAKAQRNETLSKKEAAALDAYQNINNFIQRKTDEQELGALSYAGSSPEQLAKINALMQLTGGKQITSAQAGVGGTAGRVDAGLFDTLSGALGESQAITGYQDQLDEEARQEEAEKQARLREAKQKGQPYTDERGIRHAAY